MSEENKTQASKEKNQTQSSTPVDRRKMVVKAAYMAPLILAAVKATERPAYGFQSGPIPLP
jgi:hypothetical protein